MTYRIPPGLNAEEGRAWLSERRRQYRIENAERVEAGRRAWREANPDYHKNYLKEWHKTPTAKAGVKRWRLENPDKVREMRRDAEKRWSAKNPEKAAEKRRRKKRRYAERNPEKLKAQRQRNTQRMRERHPEKVIARKALWLAVQRGDVIPQPCSVCGKADAEAHHSDYARHFDVVWLCPPHHRDLHRRLAASDLFG